jgi:hypothetical protein
VKTASQHVPSLLVPSAAATEHSPEMRILARLEGDAQPHTPATRRSSVWLKVLYVVLAVTLLVILAFMLMRMKTPVPPQQPSTLAIAQGQPEVRPPDQTTHNLSAEQPAPPAATIVETQAITRKASSVPVAADSRPKPVQRREAKRPAQQEGKKQETASTPQTKPRDSEVDLLTALVAHSRRLVTAPSPSAPPHSGVVPAIPANNTTSAAVTPMRQVVLRNTLVSTADLVKQCGELGWLEGWLCKRRICDNLWGKDPACTSSSASVSAP